MKSTLYAIGYCLFCWAFVSFFDFRFGGDFCHQLHSRGFSSTPGTITHSEVTESHGRGGTTFGVDIRYHYEVGGNSYEGDRFRYGAGSSTGSGWAENAVHQHPVGSSTPVYYDPKNPGDSLLSTGVDGLNVMMIIFLTPFNVVLICMPIMGISRLRIKFFLPVAGGVKIVRHGAVTRVRLQKFTPLVTALATTGVVAVPMILLVVITSLGFHPSILYAEVVLGLIIATGVAAFLRESFRALTGRLDMVIDSRNQLIELPKTCGRKARQTIQFSEIKLINLETDAPTNSEGTNSEGFTTYKRIPTIWLHQKEIEPVRLVTWYNKTKAELFTVWLKQQIPVACDGSLTR